MHGKTWRVMIPLSIEKIKNLSVHQNFRKCRTKLIPTNAVLVALALTNVQLKQFQQEMFT